MKYVLQMHVATLYHQDDEGYPAYRVVSSADTTPTHGDSVMIQPPNDWACVVYRAYQLDGTLIVHLTPPWPRDRPLPPGWSIHAPWEPVPEPGRAEPDGLWHVFAKGSHLHAGGFIAERLVSKFEPGPPPTEKLTLAWWPDAGLGATLHCKRGPGWVAMLDQRIIGYCAGGYTDEPPTAWADQCLAGCYYEGTDARTRKFVWADGSQRDAI